MRSRFVITRLVILAILLASTQLMAEEQDIVGVYFDEAATITTHETTSPMESVHLWVAVKNMSATADFAGLLFRLTENGIGYNYLNSLIGGQNFATINGEYSFGADPAIPAQECVLISIGGILVQSPSDKYEYHITPNYGYSNPALFYHTVDSVIHELTPSSGSFVEPVAVINPKGTVPNSETTWGQVKHLYR